MQHKVSVVIPVYNVEQYLEECVNSVIKQTYKNIEIILVDDGSTDNSGRLCDELANTDQRIKVFHKENGGLSDARNYGMDRSDGTYIYFLDSDDLIEPYAIETLTDTAVSHAADVVLFDARVIDENGVPQMDIPSYMWYYRIGEYSGVYSGKKLFDRLERNREYRSAVPLLFLKREAIRQRFVPILHEDELFTLQFLYSVEKAVYHPEVLYVRRVRAGSITTVRKTPKHYMGLQTVMFEAAKIPGFDVAIARYINRLYARLQVIYHNLPKDEKMQLRKAKKEMEDFVWENRFFQNKKLKRAYIKWHFPGYALSGYRLELKMAKYIDKLKKWQYYRKRLADMKKTKEKERIFVIGTPMHGNLGDHAIAIAEEKMIKEVLPNRKYVEIEMPFYRRCKNLIKKRICSKDVIIVSGGGWMGNQWFHNELVVREIVKNYPRNPVIIFPQTIYYEPSERREKDIADAKEIYAAHPNMILCLRDRQSYEFAIEHGFGKCIYVPDIVLYEKRDTVSLARSGVLFCKRYDCEKCVSDGAWEELETYFADREADVRYTTTVIGKVPLKDRETAFFKKIMEFSRAELIVTDRLHAMIFAAITGTACVAFDNTSRKVSGVYEWIAHLPYIKCVADTEEAKREIEELRKQDMQNREYVRPDFTALKDVLVSMSKKHN